MGEAAAHYNQLTTIGGALTYANANIAVLLSYREGLPKALLESAACGKPLVATDVPGCREICRDGETGLLVPPRNVERAADALVRLAGDAALRIRMGRAARTLAERDPDLSARTILYLVTEDWYFWSHRLPVARAARDAGARVVVAARMAAHRASIEAEGFAARDIPFDRSGMNPIRDRSTIDAIRQTYRSERPDLVHHVAMKPVLYGSYAARREGVPAVVNAMAGLGFLFVSRGAAGRLLRPVVRCALHRACDRGGTLVIVQNDDDRGVFEREIGVDPARIAVVRGSGVDTAAFVPRPEPAGPPVALFVGRLLRDKGVEELVGAARLLKRRGVALKVRLVGGTDANPASIPQETLDEWRREGVVELAGPTDDVAGAYANAHIAVLLSYREGLPKALLEGAACGRPLLATDVPGCREICRNGETGLLVPPRNVERAADALARLAGDAALRARMGRAARTLAERDFADTRIAKETLALYARLIGSR